VLARLPDVSAELQLQRSATKPAAGDVGYRFDPAQPKVAPPVKSGELRRQQPPSLKSELLYSPQTARPLRPHVFERGRTAERKGLSRPTNSAILPLRFRAAGYLIRLAP
jgi:hypothetical protein